MLENDDKVSDWRKESVPHINLYNNCHVTPYDNFRPWYHKLVNKLFFQSEIKKNTTSIIYFEKTKKTIFFKLICQPHINVGNLTSRYHRFPNDQQLKKTWIVKIQRDSAANFKLKLFDNPLATVRQQ